MEVKPTLFPSVPRVYEKVYAAVKARPRRAAGSSGGSPSGRSPSAQRKVKGGDGALLGLQARLADKLVLGKVRARMGGRMRYAVSGGAPLAPEIAEFFGACGLTILEGYGMTECTTAATMNRPGGNRIRHGRPCASRDRAADRGGRRDPDPRRQRLRRLLPQPGGDGRDADRGRLAAERGHRHDRRGRLPLDHRPQEGHPGHLRRQERLAAGDRERAQGLAVHLSGARGRRQPALHRRADHGRRATRSRRSALRTPPRCARRSSRWSRR